LPEQILHERADVEANLRPQRLVVWLEDHPLRAAEEAFLDKERQTPHRNVLPFRSQAVGAQLDGASTTSSARRSLQRLAAAVHTLIVTSTSLRVVFGRVPVSNTSGGTHSRLKMSVLLRA
jgi:hypothetical protein